MAVASDTYGTVARLEHRIGDLVASRTFTSGTNPKLAGVEQILDDVADELNAIMKAVGYTVPVSASDDPEAYNLLMKANVAGAGAIILNIFPTVAVSLDDPDPLANRIGGLQHEYNKVIDLIKEHLFPATRATGRLARMVSGSRLDKNLSVKSPIFTRANSDFPSSRSLTTKDS